MASVIVAISAFAASVQAMLTAGRLKLEQSTVDVGEKSSPTGQKLSGPFEAIDVKDPDDLEAILPLADGKVSVVISGFLDSFNAARRLKFRNELIEAAKNSPEYQYQVAAKNILDLREKNVKVAKRYRDLDMEALVALLKTEAEEE